jgi:Tol biopolymer transport system component
MMRSLAASLLSTALLSVSIPAAERRPIAETDLYSFHWIAAPRISPDGSRIAYTHVTVNQKHDGYETALWIISSSGGAARQLTSGPHDTSPAWSPDSRMIAFVRAVEKDGKAQPSQLYLLSMEGGEARALTELPKGASAPVWAPDGRSIAFSSTTIPADLEKKKDDKNEEKTDVRVIVRATYRSNGTGYLEPDRPTHIWTVEVPKTAADQLNPKQVTSGEFSENDIVFSRDGSKIYFTSRRVVETDFEVDHTDLYSVPTSGGGITKITGLEGPIRQMSLSPDGTRMAFSGAIDIGPDGVQRSYSQSDLFITSLQPGSTPRNLTANYDYDIAGGIGGDQAPPRGSGPSKPFWSKDGRFVYIVSAEEGRANLKRIDAETGKVEPLTEGDHDLFAYNSTPDASQSPRTRSSGSRISTTSCSPSSTSPSQR